MKCLNEENVSRYLDDEMDDTERQEVMAHLASCRSCRERLTETERSEYQLRKALAEPWTEVKAFITSGASSCPSEHLLLGYLCHELATSDSDLIEQHLKSCDICIDQLRLLSSIQKSSRLEILDPVPLELKTRVSRIWRHGVADEGEKTQRESPFKLVMRLVATGLEILRDSCVPPNMEVSLLASPVLAGAFRSGEHSVHNESNELFIARKQIAEGGLKVEVRIRKESDHQVRLVVTLSKAEARSHDARVSLLREGLLFHSKKTGPNGEVEFTNIPAGRYVLKISSELIQWPIEIEDQ